MTQSLLSGQTRELSSIEQEMAQHNTEPALRWAVTASVAEGDFPSAQATLARYRIAASADQAVLMDSWITSHALALGASGEIGRADQTMRLLFALGNDARAYAGLGQLYQTLGNVDLAQSYLSQSLKIQENAQTYLRLGEIYAQRGLALLETNYPEAKRQLILASNSFESAMRLDAQSGVYASYRLGDIYWKLNRPQDGVKAYRYAAEKGGQSHYAFLSTFYLGQIYSAWWAKNLDYNLAHTYFERALHIAADNREQAMSLSGMAFADASRGQSAQALNEYQEAISRDPDYEPARRALSVLESK
ncbi:MAG: hypothetical protein M1132_05270 [Chloroflexi bacterium]|nr:hypothetical protein [Chloroflexota bacterium]